ncbi:MAG: hypothetical protein HRU80_02625 [Ignavibacteriales bacterium]|nr:MAG: hypothetical protein HRU80_02625 [Ignavibacteriales bacterium]
MATVEDVIKVLEEYGVPMSFEQIEQSILLNPEDKLSRILCDEEIVKLRVEIFTENKTGKHINNFYELYWTKNDFELYFLTMLKTFNLSRASKYRIENIKLFFMPNLSTLIGASSLTKYKWEKTNTEVYYCAKSASGVLSWEKLNYNQLLKILKDSSRFTIYIPSKLSSVEDYIIYETQNDEYKDSIERFRLQTIRILRGNPETTFKELVFKLNSKEIHSIFPKPYSKKTILEIIKANEKYFNVEGDQISLKVNVDFVLNELKSDPVKINLNQELPEGYSGIIALKFIGTDFPLQTAVEYVKIRKIVSIVKTTVPNTFFARKRNIMEILRNSEMFRFLSSFLGDSDKATEWMTKNLEVTFYSDTEEYIERIFPEILEKLSPVFNLENNPGNLFATTLREFVKETDNAANK